jgi:hypothetical protein
MEPMEQEYQQANEQLEHEIWESLDRCFKAGAPVEDLRFIAWQAGATKWSPPANVVQLRR